MPSQISARAVPPRRSAPSCGSAADELTSARRALGQVLAAAGRPAKNPRLRLTSYADGRVAPIVVVQVSATVGAWPVRAQVAASTARDAADRAIDDLRHHLDRLCRHLSAAEAGATTFTTDEWSTAPLAAPAGLTGTGSRPGTLVRRKTCSPAVQSIDEAAFTMDLREYRFHLFTDEDGHDALVFRGGPSGYRLIRTQTTTGSLHCSAPVTVRPQPAHQSTVAEAAAALVADATRQFLFFLDPEHRRGRVLYRRCDGHLGLLAAVP